ncbi:asparaginyl-tRNA synthetase-like protein [Calycina marina]|uniref:asparagine--tRNA ligase n=1 Tax=Calycina marina TaxID=1763456 RepID=A0A9P7Z0E9_9HELO|nr:asparaginyl-tRNA synthetase-like protein [Calycina marina]
MRGLSWPLYSLSSHSRQFHCTPRSYAAIRINQLLSRSPENVFELDTVEVNGRVRSVRRQKKWTFASIGDGTTLEPLQAIMTPEQAENISTGTGVELVGKWKASPYHESQSHELHVETLRIVAPVDSATYPMQKKTQVQGHSVEYLRSMPHMRVRQPFTQLLMEFQSACDYSFQKFFHKRGFVKTLTPILTSSDCEAGGETFSIKGPITKNEDGTFFKTQKHLTVSHQLELEALAQARDKVWSFSPTFRAEKSDTSRHLSEFYMLEAEQTYVHDKKEIMDLVENCLRSCVWMLWKSSGGKAIIYGKRSEGPGDEEAHGNLTKTLEARFNGLMEGGWPRITYSKAISLLESAAETFEHDPVWGGGLTSQHEHYIAATVGRGSPVFVTNYPKSIKPFYMLSTPAQPPDLGEMVENFDLLVPDVCELAGGSMRENNLETLVANMQEKGLLPQKTDGHLSDEDLGTYKDYVDLRRWGYVPSGGFGLGFNRLIMYLAGVPNIREVSLYPRTYGH